MCLQDCGNETTYFETPMEQKKERKSQGKLESTSRDEEMKNTTYQNLWYMAKMVLNRKIFSYKHVLKNPGMFPINNLICNLRT